MRVMHKEQLQFVGVRQTFRVPYGSKIRKFDLQNEKPTIWIEKPIGQGLDVDLHVQIFGTGYEEIPENATYIDSIIVGIFVWHLYKLEF